MNTPTLPDWVRPILSRIIGAVVAGIAAGIARRYAFDVTPEQQQHITDWGVTGATTLVLAIYAATHRGGSARTNPLDAASPSIAPTATGPMGDGERTALGERLDAAAESGSVRGKIDHGAPVVSVRTEKRDADGNFEPPKKSEPAKAAAKPRAPRATRKKKEAGEPDVVKLRRETDIQPHATDGGFGDFVPTATDLPRNISPRPKLSSDDSGIL